MCVYVEGKWKTPTRTVPQNSLNHVKKDYKKGISVYIVNCFMFYDTKGIELISISWSSGINSV